MLDFLMLLGELLLGATVVIVTAVGLSTAADKIIKIYRG